MRKPNLFAGLTLLALLISLLPPAWGSEGDTFHIYTAGDWLQLVKNCSYDGWSEGKTVILERDISLAGAECRPVPSFGGVFEGGGHTVSQFSLTGQISPAGLFGTIAAQGEVRDLKVEGTVAPEGSGQQVGGLAGLNRGAIQGCTFTGTVEGRSCTGGLVGENAPTGLIRSSTAEGGVFGRSMTGGVVGKNCGTANSCESRCYVNTNTVDPSLTLTELNLDAWNSLRRLVSPDTYNVNTDSGGIAGYSEGFVLNCTNRGTVGYQHIGYNVGGVVGRNRGHVYGCTNTGRVYGRRGVGGVAGLAEPDVVMDLSESSLAEIRARLSTLSDLVDKAARNGDASSEKVSARLTAIGDRVETSEDLAQTLTDQLTGYVDDTVAEINRGSEILDGAIDRLGEVTEGFREASGTLTEALDALDRAAAVLEEEKAFDRAQNLAIDVRLAAENLEESLTQTKKALDTLMGAVKPANGGNRETWRRQIDQGIDQTWSGLSQTLQSMTQIHSLLSGVSASLEAGELPTFTGLRDAFRGVAEGLDQVRKGLTAMGSATDVSFSDFDWGLIELREALFTLGQGAPGEAGGAFFYLSKAMEELEALAATGERSFTPLHEGIGLLRDASGQMTAALDKAVGLTNYLRDQDRLTFQSLGEQTDQTADDLYDSLHSISGELEGLNSDIKGASDQLTQDVRAINSQFNALMNTLLDVVQEVEDAKAEDLIQDTSEEDMEAVTLGKIAHSRNEGEINGDLNVGGVAGAMEIYDPVDPEGDDQPTMSSLVHRKYRLKCILQNCVNTGTVTARRSRVGAVCGEAALGVIWGCVAQGSAKSEDGDYVGGIVGRGDNVVRSCYARCFLWGRRYVGGIVGGMAQNSRSVVENCRSLVEITEAAQHAGAIAGEDKGVLTGNLFVSDTLAGAGEISTRGRAQPVDYETLLQDPALPASFRTFTLTFQAEEATVDSRTFRYGDSFPDLTFPAIPAREGMYARWDREELDHLTFDTVVTAQYHPYVTALACTQNRSGNRAAFYAEGEFDDQSRLEAVPAPREFQWPDRTFWGRIRSYHRQVVEQWRLTCPGQGEVTLRYLPPESVGGRLEVYLARGESWERVETDQIGSCLVMRVPVQSELTFLSVGTPWWVWGLMGVLALLVAALLLTFLVRKKKPKVQPGETPPPPDPQEIKRRKAHRNLRLGLLTASLVLAGAIVAVVLNEPIVESVEIARLVRSYSEREDLDMELTAAASLNGEDLGITVDIAKRRVEDRQVTALTAEGVTLYTCEGVVLLENGKAWRTSVHVPEYGSLLTKVATLFRELDVTSQEVNGVKTYHVLAAGERAGELLSNLLPLGSDSGFQEAQVDLVVVDGELSRVEASWTADRSQVRGVLTIRENPQELTVPQPVRNTLRNGSYLEAPEAGEDLEVLAVALADLASREPLNSQVSLSVNCGPLLLSERVDYWRTKAYEKELTLVSRQGANLWFTPEEAALDSGLSAELGEARKLDAGGVLALAYQALLLGESDVQKGEGYARYTLALEGEAMTRFAAAIAPDTADLPLQFERGQLVLTIRRGKVATLSVRCEGSISVVTAQVPASVSLRLTPSRLPMPVPSEKVIEALHLEAVEP